jgi:hypothetical protein
MSESVKANLIQHESITSSTFSVDKIQDFCPICQKGIEPIHRFGWFKHPKLWIVFECPRRECRELFIAYYEKPYSGITGPEDRDYALEGCAPWKVKPKDFPEEIAKISEKFSKIYNEAKEAEERKLTHICGAGYRRALEFLIKDYLIREEVEKPEKIKETRLGTCIDKYIDSQRIKDCAERAAWLGNDETHYIRIWETKDLDDLKDLIQLTVNWIHDEHLTKRIKKEMPNNQRKKQNK